MFSKEASKPYIEVLGERKHKLETDIIAFERDMNSVTARIYTEPLKRAIASVEMEIERILYRNLDD